MGQRWICNPPDKSSGQRSIALTENLLDVLDLRFRTVLDIDRRVTSRMFANEIVKKPELLQVNVRNPNDLLHQPYIG